MKRISFAVDIIAPASKVYETMLGLSDKATYQYWTKVFNPTSSFEGSWDEGSKIHFIGLDENGNKRGMVSEIIENKHAEFVSIRHIGFVEGEKEILTGKEVESWAGGYENYHFYENMGVTSLKVELDTVEEYESFFNEAYPNGLSLLKEISEKEN